MTRYSQLIGIVVAALSVGALLGCGGGSGGGNTGGQGSGGATLTLQTVASNSPTTPVTPSWVAYQDGNGPWTPMTSTTTGVYTATLTNAARCYGIAVENAPSATLGIFHGTTAELSTLTVPLATSGNSSPVTVSGTVSNLPSGGACEIIAPNAGTEVVDGGSTAYAFSINSGMTDLLAAVYPNSSNMTISKLLFFRDVHILSNYPQNIDCNSTDAVTLSQTNTVSLPTGTSAFGSVSLNTQNGTDLNLGSTGGNAGSASFLYQAVPAGSLVAGDQYELYVSGTSGNVNTDSYYSGAGNRSIKLPAAIAAPTVTGTATLPSMSWGAYSGAQLYQLTYSSEGQTSGNTLAIALTPGWIANHGGSNYTLPDFSTVAGWNSAWGFSAATSLNPEIDIWSSNSTLSNLLAYLSATLSPCPNGFTVSNASNTPSNMSMKTGNLSRRLPFRLLNRPPWR